MVKAIFLPESALPADEEQELIPKAQANLKHLNDQSYSNKIDKM